MKRILFVAAVAIAATACLKDETVKVETAQEINFKAMTNVATKADLVHAGAQHEGVYLPDAYRIYASATQKNKAGEVENAAYFKDHPFDTETAGETVTYHAWDVENDEAAPLYWPLGGFDVDYIAYAMPVAVHDADPALVEGPVATYKCEATDVASHLAFHGWDTYKNQVDVLYAVANSQTTAANGDDAGQTVHLVFDHAQALLAFEAKVDIPNVLQINEIKINGLKVKGDFVIDNTKNNLVAEWDAATLVGVNGEDIVAEGPEPENDNIHEWDPSTPVQDPTDVQYEYLDNTEYEQVGSTLLIPEQPSCNFIITYTISGNQMVYEHNIDRKTWKKGYKYIYKLDFDLNEIVITEDVTAFTVDTTEDTIE